MKALSCDRNRFAGDFARPAGEVVETLGGGRRIDELRLEDRLAVVDRLDASDLGGVRGEHVGERQRILARSRGFIFCQSDPGSICARAAATAASTSSAPAEATSAMFSSVAGLVVENVSPDRASTNSPLMKSFD